MDLAAEIEKKLLEVNAIKLNAKNPFTWASGIMSPIYCDNRISLSYPETRTFIKKHLAELSKSFGQYDTIAGVATAGIAHGALIADYLEKPFIYVRSKAKAHGRENLIEGHLKPHSKVLVVEDLISTGMSSLKAVDAIKMQDCEVVGVVAIFNYAFPKAFQSFSDANCKFKTLSNYPALLKEALTQNYITEQEAELLGIWNQDPQKWAETFKTNDDE